MGGSKIFVLYLLALMGLIGLAGMAFGYTEPSLIKAALFIVGITLLLISVFKEKTKLKSI
ncbi:hypothetical protein GCM10028778_24210 [Barrientosiimonas marina]|uniref:DUF1328 domain-containing protein n=1 Tax=Lentibacillus kimchii TaxID=1542911 RepID=A0ABW2UUI8_9BACI